MTFTIVGYDTWIIGFTLNNNIKKNVTFNGYIFHPSKRRKKNKWLNKYVIILLWTWKVFVDFFIFYTVQKPNFCPSFPVEYLWYAPNEYCWVKNLS